MGVTFLAAGDAGELVGADADDAGAAGVFLAGAFLVGAFFATFLATFLATAFFAGAFFGAAFFAAAFLTGFLGVSRTLCLSRHGYQLRHG